jgi:RNA polymerase sigma factor (sigma-70 family)
VSRPESRVNQAVFEGSFDLVAGVRDGRPEVLRWLELRCERRAAPRFAAWAWEHVRDDFIADTMAQLTVTMTKDGFALRTTAEAYVDRTIANLCTRYFLLLARLRRSEPIEVHADHLPSRSTDRLERVALALDLRLALSELDPACRRLLLGKYVDGSSLEELGEVFGISAQTARSRLHTCRERLRRVWSRLLQEPQPPPSTFS